MLIIYEDFHIKEYHMFIVFIIIADKCGDTVSKLPGNISLSTYQGNQTCKWQFKLPEDKKIYLLVQHLLLQSGDILAFYDGDDTPDNLIVKITDNSGL